MDSIKICKLTLELNLNGMVQAVSAMFDIYEGNALYDFEFIWVNGHSERGWVDDYFFGEDFDRDAFIYNACKGLFKYCKMSGHSDQNHKRKVDIVWDPWVRGTDILRLELHGGVPCNDVEKHLINKIDSVAFPFGFGD